MKSVRHKYWFLKKVKNLKTDIPVKIISFKSKPKSLIKIFQMKTNILIEKKKAPV